MDDIELKDEEEGEGNDVIEDKNSKIINRREKTNGNDKNKKTKIQQHRRNKLKLMTTFFRVNTLIFNSGKLANAGYPNSFNSKIK